MVPQRRPVLPFLSVVPPSRRALSVCPLDANEERRDGEGQHRLVMTEMDEIMSEDGWMDACFSVEVEKTIGKNFRIQSESIC